MRQVVAVRGILGIVFDQQLQTPLGHVISPEILQVVDQRIDLFFQMLGLGKFKHQLDTFQDPFHFGFACAGNKFPNPQFHHGGIERRARFDDPCQFLGHLVRRHRLTEKRHALHGVNFRVPKFRGYPSVRLLGLHSKLPMLPL